MGILKTGFHRLRPPGRGHFGPGDIVIRPGGIGEAPVTHGAFWIDFHHFLKATKRFTVMERVTPVKAAVEPLFGFRFWRGYIALLTPQIKIDAHIYFPRGVLIWSLLGTVKPEK